jgi:2'-5' RNA ligase
MPREIDLRLLSTPTLELPNIGVGDISQLTEYQQSTILQLASVARRNALVQAKKALPDGSYPIPNVSYLKKAIQAYGRAKNKSKVRAWIIRRARGLKRTDLLPESWGSARTNSAITADMAGIIAGDGDASQSSSDHTDGIMVAIYPPSNVAHVLAGDQEGDEPESELHVTLAYLGTVDEFTPEQLAKASDALTKLSMRTQAINAHVQGVGTFIAPDGNDPHWYSVDAVGLAQLRTDIVLALEAVDVEPRVDHDFTPHMTIRYGGESLPEKIPPGGEVEWLVSSFCFVVGTDVQEIPLSTSENSDVESYPESEQKSYSLNGLVSVLDLEVREPMDRKYLPIVNLGIEEFVKAPGPCTLNKSAKHNWVEDVGGLPNYICQVARGIARGGRTLDSAIPIAVGTIRNWAEGKGKVSAAVRARAAEAIAEWEAKRAKAKATPNHSVHDEELTAEDLADVATLTEGLSLQLEERDMGTTVEPDPVVADGAPTTVEEAPPADEAPAPAGRRFRIPIVIPEGVWSGDRRRFSVGALEAKDPPIPVLWQKVTDEGHKQSVTVGRIDTVERLESGGLGNAEGVFDIHPDAVEAGRQVKERFLTGVSGDVDKFKFQESQNDDGEETLEVDSGRLVAATLVAKPAFQEATIEIIPEDGEEPVVVASAGPLHPPQAWFDDPKLTSPTMLEVTDDGRVFGHIAEWNAQHTGNPHWRTPRSVDGKYPNFNRRPVRTAEGSDVRCGCLTLTGGHAQLSLDPDQATRHYDDTRSVVADVVAGEDEFGVWVAGAMRPDISPEQIRAFRAAEPSGDWRFRDGSMRMLACCMVPPGRAGFPVMPRALVASGADGQETVLALVAAGMLSHNRKVDLYQRIEELSAQVATLMADHESRRRAELSAQIAVLRS